MQGNIVGSVGGFFSEDPTAEDRGIYFSDSSGNSLAQLSSSGTGLSNPIIANVTSDTIVSQNQKTVLQFIDYTNGIDTNDGLAPVATADNFNRTGNWDASTASDTYHTWTMLQGTGANLQTAAGSPGTAIGVVPASAAYEMALQAGGMFEEISGSVQTDKIPGAGGLMNLLVLFRVRNNGAWSTNANYAAFLMQIPAGGGVPNLRLRRLIDGTPTDSANNAPADGLAWAANVNWNFRAQCYYNYVLQTNIIRGKFWKSTGTEPAAWDFNGTSAITFSDAELTQRAGQVGLSMNAGAYANTPITVTWSNFTYQLLDPDKLAADDSTTGVADTTYYYSPTSTGPVATLSQALRFVNHYNQANCFLIYHNGTDTPYESGTHVDGYVGGGFICITGANPTITGSLSFNGNSTQIHVSGLTLTDPGGGVGADAFATIVVNASRWLELCELRLHGNSNVNANILATNGSQAQVQRCQMNFAVTRCLLADQASVVWASANTGGGVTDSYRANAAVIFVDLSAPTGGVASGVGGKVFVTATTEAPASTSAGNTAPSTAKKNKTWNAIGASTYGMAYGTWSAGTVTQGSYGGSQNHKGMWQYPGGVQSTLSGKTINAAYITVKRANYGGTSGLQPVYLFSANVNNLTGGEPGITSGPTLLGSLAWGQTKTFKIPQAIANDLKTAVGGATRLLGLFQSDGDPYVICSGTGEFAGSGRLKVTYT